MTTRAIALGLCLRPLLTILVDDLGENLIVWRLILLELRCLYGCCILIRIILRLSGLLKRQDRQVGRRFPHYLARSSILNSTARLLYGLLQLICGFKAGDRRLTAADLVQLVLDLGETGQVLLKLDSLILLWCGIVGFHCGAASILMGERLPRRLRLRGLC